MMKKHVLYFSYVLVHKWYAMIWCFRFGLIWRGLTHDLSKFLPSEWFQYADRVYGNDLERVRAIRSNEFDRAKSLHYHRNSHHWQHHVMVGEKRMIIVFEMSRKDVLEMVADWIAAGYAKTDKTDLGRWWDSNKRGIILHPSTMIEVEELVERWRDR